MPTNTKEATLCPRPSPFPPLWVSRLPRFCRVRCIPSPQSMAASRCFCRHHAGFCRRLPFAAGQAPGAGLLAAVLAIVGIGLPVSYFYSFFAAFPGRSNRCTCRVPSTVWSWPTPALLCGCTASRTSPNHQPPRMGQLLLRLPHGQCGVPLRRKRESLLTERPHGSGVEVFGRHPAQRKAARLPKSIRSSIYTGQKNC